MPSQPSGDTPRLNHGQVRNGDVVVRQADIAEHPELDTDSLLAKLGELGLPASIVARLKPGDRAVELAAYDSETQPALGRQPWNEFESSMEQTGLDTSQLGRFRSRLFRMHRYGIGKDGMDGSYDDQPRVPILYLQSTGEAYDAMYFSQYDEMDDVVVDIDVLYGYISHSVDRFPGIGPETEADLTRFVNSRIASLSEA